MNNIPRDLPLQIETERLLIRCPQPGDGLVVHEAVVETLGELRSWPASLPWSVFDPSVESSEAFCRQGHADFLALSNFPMLVFLKQGLIYVGGNGLHDLDWSVPSCEIGYWCRKSYNGQGIATEAVKAVSAFAIQSLGARRVVSLPDEKNVPSRRVAESAGYLLEGVMRNERKAPDGTLRNTCLYALAVDA
jgi:RimJ/RimL family protein N-acetyltransferase